VDFDKNCFVDFGTNCFVDFGIVAVDSDFHYSIHFHEEGAEVAVVEAVVDEEYPKTTT